MNLAPSRVGLVFTPTTPLWTGTVSAYAPATFRLTVSTVTGSLGSIKAGLCVYTTGGRLVRVKADYVGSNYIYLAENGLTSSAGGGFEVGSTIAVYNVRLPLPRYQRVLANQVTVTGDAYAQISDVKLFGTAACYWHIQNKNGWKIILYSDAGLDDADKIATGYIISSGAQIGFQTKNNSGASGTCVVSYSGDPTDDDGEFTLVPYEVRKDYDITFASLGGTPTAQSQAMQGPVVNVEPECAIATINQSLTFTADQSFATYYGADYRSPWPDAPATITTGNYTWALGAGGTVDSGAGTSSLVCHFTTAGFRYISLTITDSNGVSQVRYVPVWVDVEPTTDFVSGSIAFELGTSWKGQFELWTATLPFRYALVCAYDLDTRTPIFMGWIWPASTEYDFEKQKLSIEVQATLAFLQNVYARPFEIFGVKGNPISWDFFDMLSVPRAAYFLLRWHSTVMEICNVKFNVTVADIPDAGAADTPLQYIRDITAGTIGQQLNVLAASPFLALYGHALGEIEAILDPLYASDITTAAYDTMTLDLTAAQIAVMVKKQLSVPAVSDGRLGGFYYDGANYLPIVARTPVHPGTWGQPKDEQNFVVSSVAELVARAGRWAGAQNYSDSLSFRCLQHIDLKTYKLVDYPADLFTDASRLIIRRMNLTYDLEKLLWVETLEARTFGLTESAGQEAQTGPVPGTVDPVVCMDPLASNYGQPGVCVYANNVVTSSLLVYSATQMAVSFNAFESTEATVWSNLKTGLLAGVDVGKILGAALLDSGEVYCITYKDEATLADNGLWYCPDVTSPVWTLIQTPTQLRIAVGSSDNIYLSSIAARNGSTAFTTFGPYWRGGWEVGYFVCSAGVATWVNPWPVPMYTYQTDHQFTCNYNRLTGAARIGMGDPAWADRASVCDIITGGTTIWLTGDRYAYSVSPTAAVIEYTNLFYYTLGSNVAPLTPPDFTGVSNSHPVDEIGGAVYWLRSADNALMIGGAIQAIPNDSGGTDGVFSVINATPGGFLLVDTAATIQWAASSAAALNTRRSLAITQDGGFNWRSLDGNFATACGAAWIGGGTTPQPMFSYAEVTIIS